jgi:hypothetical protein
MHKITYTIGDKTYTAYFTSKTDASTFRNVFLDPFPADQEVKVLSYTWEWIDANLTTEEKTHVN